jgi:hypothetical protein
MEVRHSTDKSFLYYTFFGCGWLVKIENWSWKNAFGSFGGFTKDKKIDWGSSHLVKIVNWPCPQNIILWTTMKNANNSDVWLTCWQSLLKFLALKVLFLWSFPSYSYTLI